jgi:hypothetical protein
LSVSLGFGYKEEGEDEASKVGATPDEAHLGLRVGSARTRFDDEEWGSVAEDPVEEPVLFAEP